MSFIKILLSVPDSAQTVTDLLQVDATNNVFNENGLRNLIEKVLDGEQLAYAKVSTNPIQAVGSFAFSSFVANDTITINGRVYTGKASPSGAQQFLIGADDTATVANAAAIINADTNTSVAGVVVASASGTTLTITAVQPGLTGNAIVLANSAHATPTAMAGGTDGTQAAVNYGVPS